ncbi:MAG: hypothetical protein H7095_06580 [Pseudopedobacter sp.]|nr:hypothetical protein [Deinococcales bacterium]
MTKHRKSRLLHDTLALSLKKHFPLHATRLTVLCAVVLAMITPRSEQRGNCCYGRTFSPVLTGTAGSNGLR